MFGRTMPADFETRPPSPPDSRMAKAAPRVARSLRRDGRRVLRWLLIVMAAWNAAPEPAHAYLDPATGSMIIQIATGTVLGAVLVVKSYWHRIKGYFSSDPPETTGAGEEAHRLDDHE